MSLGAAFAARGVTAERELPGGHRNRVFLVRQGQRRLVAKTTRHAETALQWLRPVLLVAAESGLGAPPLIADPSGEFGRAGLTLEPYIGGTGAGAGDVLRLQPRLAVFHARLRRLRQRPGVQARAATRLPVAVSGRARSAATLAMRTLGVTPFGVVHGDVTRANCLVSAVGLHLIDWDECRRDSLVFDLPLRCVSSAVARARGIAEIGAGWKVEPAYARRLLTGASGQPVRRRPSATAARQTAASARLRQG